MSIENIAIIGGGTAGWLTALLLNAHHPHKKITVVESDDIGILGAGEGTVSHFINVLDLIGIPVSDIVKHADGTIKSGIKFTNWNSTNTDDYYYHPFGVVQGLNYMSLNTGHFNHTCLTPLIGMYKGDSFKNINFIDKTSEKFKVPMISEHNINAPTDNTMFQYKGLSSYAMHFNARKLAEFLKSVAISRGIIRTEGIVNKINSNNDDNINSLVLDNKEVINCDFVFDCTGFKRLIIGNHFKSKWKSYSKYLPCDTAMPFFIKSNSNTEPYTEAIAMKYGWVWKIPVQERYGCGYVFDSKYIGIEEAKQEVEEYFGCKIESPRTFNFNAGCYEEPWIKNCIAVGLSSGFIEPLEATSIWTSSMNVLDVAVFFDRLENNDQRDRDVFNQRFIKRNNEIADFLFFHYMGKRNDSSFWQDWKTKEQPESLKNLSERWKYTIPSFADEGIALFSLESWMAVAIGINWLELDVVKRYIDSNNIDNVVGGLYEPFKQYQDDAVNACMDHDEFLNILKKC